MVGRLPKSQTGALNAAVAYIKGAPAAAALRYAGYSEKTVNHNSKASLHSVKMQTAFKCITGILAEELGNEQTMELCDGAMAPEARIDLGKRLYQEFSGRSVNEDSPALKRLPEITKLMLLDDPEEESKGLVPLNLDEPVKVGELGAIARQCLRKDLLNPPENARDRNALYRTALEADGQLGAAAASLHLHEHHMGLPPIVQQMLLERMKELQERRAGVIDAEIVAPPDPISGEAKDYE